MISDPPVDPWPDRPGAESGKLRHRDRRAGDRGPTSIAPHRIDAVVLVDGGTDTMLRGDEAGLGPPEEDLTSVAALAALDGVPQEAFDLGWKPAAGVNGRALERLLDSHHTERQPVAADVTAPAHRENCFPPDPAPARGAA
ncbi:FAD-dependent monooxygenase [Streptomyces sp. NPDC048392]|uniref:FAD-dependent monooxygenase n=1 Tax=Streptomyces sp. NPDC048392 TaxID=3365543 RepID=UPI00372291C8